MVATHLGLLYNTLGGVVKDLVTILGTHYQDKAEENTTIHQALQKNTEPIVELIEGQ